CTTSRAALLSVPVGEQRALLSNPINVWGAVSHHAEVVGTDVVPTDVVTPDDQYVWFVCHLFLLSFLVFSHCLRREKAFPFLLLLILFPWPSSQGWIQASIASPIGRFSSMDSSQNQYG